VNAETPAVVLKLVPELFHHGGLAVVRTLGRLGVPVYGVHDTPRAPAALSRYSAGKFVYREGDDPLRFLREVASTVGTRPLLVPQDDVSTLFVDAHANELRELFLFPEQPAGLTRRLANKRELAELCAQLDIPTPNVAFPRTRADVEAFADELSMPVVMKPTESFIPGTGLRGRLVVAHTRERLLAEWDDMDGAERSNTMLQEYVPGGPESVWMFNGYFDASSECLAGFTGCKLHQSPPFAGVTSLGVCLENGVVSEMTKRLMKEVGYRGVVDMDYRFDERDGKYKLLDANPRVGATFRLFVDRDTGVDVVRALYLDLTGQPVAPARTPVGRKWLLDPWDVKSCLAYRRDGRLTLRGWARAYRGVEELAWLATDDPLPFLALTAHVLSKRFRRAR
jgi:predicted ATP-grasp superfamily ATP-dependent carboligase